MSVSLPYFLKSKFKRILTRLLVTILTQLLAAVFFGVAASNIENSELMRSVFDDFKQCNSCFTFAHEGAIGDFIISEKRHTKGERDETDEFENLHEN